MLDEKIKNIIKCKVNLTYAVLDVLPPEVSKTIKSWSRLLYDAVGEALKESAPPEKAGNSGIPIE